MKRIVALLVAAILLVSMTAPTMMADASANGNTNGAGNGNTCSADGGCSDSEECDTCGCCGNMTVEDLDGAEENKAIAEALKNHEVKDLRKELIDRGYTPKVSEANATVVEGCNNATVVRIPFKTHGEEVNASIVWQEANGVEDARALVMGLSNSGEFSKSMEILRENETYQEMKTNLSENFTVKENNAKVVLSIKDGSENALVIVPVEGKDGSILVAIDLDAEEVTYITDWDWCVAACKTVGAFGVVGCAVGLCYAIPPSCPVAEIICSTVAYEGVGACIDWCEEQ